jgi:hypothetical protein
VHLDRWSVSYSLYSKHRGTYPEAYTNAEDWTLWKNVQWDLSNVYTLSGQRYVLQDILNQYKHWSSGHLEDSSRENRRTPTLSRLLSLRAWLKFPTLHYQNKHISQADVPSFTRKLTAIFSSQQHIHTRKSSVFPQKTHMDYSALLTIRVDCGWSEIPLQ